MGEEIGEECRKIAVRHALRHRLGMFWFSGTVSRSWFRSRWQTGPGKRDRAPLGVTPAENGSGFWLNRGFSADLFSYSISRVQSGRVAGGYLR